MRRTLILLVLIIPFVLITTVGVVYLFVLIVKALNRYISSTEVREEKRTSLKTLGEVIKKYPEELIKEVEGQ